MGKSMTNLTRQDPISLCRGRTARTIPAVPRQAQHPTQQSARGTTLQQHRPVRFRRQPDLTLPGRFDRFRQFAWQVTSNAGQPGAARRHPRTNPAGRVARRTDGGTQIHHGLGIVPGPHLRRQPAGAQGQFGFRRRKRCFHLIQSRHHPLDVAIHNGRGQIESNRPNRRCGIGANAGQRLQRRQIGGKDAAVPRHHGPRTGQQIAGAGVIAEPRPSRHHLGVGGTSKRCNCRPAVGKADKISTNCRHRGLLQHHLGKPDAIGIRAQTSRAIRRRYPPRHHSGMPVIPNQQLIA